MPGAALVLLILALAGGADTLNRAANPPIRDGIRIMRWHTRGVTVRGSELRHVTLDEAVATLDGRPLPCFVAGDELWIHPSAARRPQDHAPYDVVEIRPAWAGATPCSANGEPWFDRGDRHEVFDVRGFRPDALEYDAAAWRSWREADYLIVAPQGWLDELQPLVAHRESLGHHVAVVGVEWLYARYSHGNPSPEAIERFVLALSQHSAGRLTWVLLAGDTWSYGDRGERFLPVAARHLTKLGYAGRRPRKPTYPTDDGVALAAGGGRRLAVGRIPARTPEQLSAVIGKIIEYEAGPASGDWRRRLTIFTGPARYGLAVDTMVEATAKHLLDTAVPYDYDLTFVFAKPESEYAWPAPLLGRRLVDELNRGALIAGYVGHGREEAFDSVRFGWRKFAIGTVDDARSLDIDQGKPFFISLTCLTGAFDRTRGSSIAEALLLNPSGPIGVFAAGRVVHPYVNGLYAQAMIELFFDGRPRTVGEGLVALKARARELRSPLVELAMGGDDGRALLDEHDGLYNLFGDPATRLRYPGRLEVSRTPAGPTVPPGAPVRVRFRLEGAPGAGALVTVETQRSRIRGQLTPWSELQRLPEEEMVEAMRANYAKAMNKIVSRHEVRLGQDGRAELEFTAPSEPGSYYVKVLVDGPTAAGHVALQVAAAP